MSDTVSSASQTVATQLSDAGSNLFSTTPKEILGWMTFNLKLVLFMSLFILLVSIIMSILNLLLPTPPPQDDTIVFRPPMFKSRVCGGRWCRGCGCPDCPFRKRFLEKFENTIDKVAENAKEFSRTKNADYQSISLVAPNDENKNPSNMFLGQATRYTFEENGTFMYKLDIFCDLPVIGGDVFSKDVVNQLYKVYLYNPDTNTNLYIDDLKKDGDGLYKLSYRSNKTELVDYNIIRIIYSIDNNEGDILLGRFM